MDWPHAYSPQRLERNLAALGEVDGELAERLCWPIADGNVSFLDTGACLLRHQRVWRPLDLERCGGRGLLRRRSSGGLEAPGLIFGLGLGELAEQVLSAAGPSHWVAYERDPLLLRLALARVDFCAALRSGRLRLALGSDVLALAGQELEGPLVAHPLLGAIYERELWLVEKGLDGPPAFLVDGELFVDQLGSALRRRGYSVVTLEVQRLAVEELARAVSTAKPALIAAINYTHGLAEFCEQGRVPLLCWEIDPSLDHVAPLARACPNSRIFTYREAHVQAFEQAGFQGVQYLPLAADTHSRGPSKVIGTEAVKYRSAVSFVGASMAETAREQKRQFLGLLADKRGKGRDAGVLELERLLARQREEPNHYRLADDLERCFPDLLDALCALNPGLKREAVLADVAACEKRLLYVGACAEFGVDVWGDSGWRDLEQFGVRYKGGAGHRLELNKVYSNSQINLDVGRVYQPDIVTMRVFDVLACGGFCLTEDSAEVRRLFHVGHELDTYQGVEELEEKLNFYLARPERIREIGAAGLRAIRERHNLDQRLDGMLSVLRAA